MPLKRSSPGPSGSSSTAKSKRTRFETPAEAPGAEVDDALLEEDLPEGGGKQSKKLAKEDAGGYNSDSSDDGEGVVPNRAKKTAEEADEDEDMFALSDDEEKDKKGKGKEKEKGKEKDEVMTLDDVEGQEMASGDAEDGNSDSEDEEMRAELAKGLDGPMGFEMTGFNMKRELEEGTMTKDGEDYQENEKDPGDAQDVWLAGMEKDEIKKARRGKRERERLEKEREEKERGGGVEGAKQRKEREEEMFRQAVALMERGETIMEALQRLGIEVEKERKKKEQEQGKKKMTWAEKQRERKALLASGSDESDPAHPHANPFTHLSEIVSAMTATGHLDVYSLTRESLQRMLPAAPAAPAAPLPTFDERKFQYRFSMAYISSLPADQRPVEREVFGPFPTQALVAWRATGFFGGESCERVELRQVATDGQSGEWGSWASVIGS